MKCKKQALQYDVEEIREYIRIVDDWIDSSQGTYATDLNYNNIIKVMLIRVTFIINKFIKIFIILLIILSLVSCNIIDTTSTSSDILDTSVPESLHEIIPSENDIDFKTNNIITIGEKEFQIKKFTGLSTISLNGILSDEGKYDEIFDKLIEKMDELLPNHPDNLSYIGIGVDKSDDGKKYYTIKVVRKTDREMDFLYYFFTVNLDDLDDWYIADPVTAQYIPFRNEMGVLTPGEVRELLHLAFFPELNLEEIPSLVQDYANELSIEIEGKTFEIYIVSELNFISIWDEETEKIYLFYYHII